ncbi:hypothetical protein I4641_10160 [Waterburya agarophytonicola K14]|uniref:Uncharacterized protein n=1 Tax=Waterburya agarophytonicola KI4 TaxID=2874699 RepID=A0A964BQB2_9CYAN|nr:hypothetical protein [Waterburya agarophytonicola]MCC0177339.1 hypothetical protein [Waterburya agarophytonicola KI4]
MNFKSVAAEFLKLGKYKTQEMSVSTTAQKHKNSQFSFKLYGLVTSLLLGSVAGINWAIDPLWYSHGNILTGKNFTFNERITKTNLFLRTKDKVNYDCIILGSSRVTALRTSNFKEEKCFNYALKGGEIPDFVNYAESLKNEGVNPKTVYIGVDGLNFVEKERKSQEPVTLDTLTTKSPLQAYLSADVLLFSVMTLLGISPDPGNYYDRDFEPVDFSAPPVYTPRFYKPQPPQKCDLSSVETFKSLRSIFPNAKFIGYVPPRSAWSMINDTYARELMDCDLLGFHELAQSYDVMYDFSAPSNITKNPNNTFDGSHYSVIVNNQIADILQGKDPEEFGIRVDQYNFEEYRNLYRQKLKNFLAENERLDLWQESPEILVNMVEKK